MLRPPARKAIKTRSRSGARKAPEIRKLTTGSRKISAAVGAGDSGRTGADVGTGVGDGNQGRSWG